MAIQDKKIRTLFHHPIWSNVIGGLILSACLSIFTYFLNWWPIIWGGLISAWNWLKANTEVPNWFLLPLGLLALMAVAMAIAGIWYRLYPGTSEKNWRDYASDIFLGIRWRWHYAGNQILRVSSFCPSCDYQVYPQNISSYDFIDRISLSCENCGLALGRFDESHEHLEDRVKRLIQQKLRNGTWNTVENPLA